MFGEKFAQKCAACQKKKRKKIFFLIHGALKSTMILHQINLMLSFFHIMPMTGSEKLYACLELYIKNFILAAV